MEFKGAERVTAFDHEGFHHVGGQSARGHRGRLPDMSNPTREQAWDTLTRYTKSEPLLRQAQAVEASVRWYADRFGATVIYQDKTWAFLKELDSCIEYYPTGTGAVMKELGEGSRDMTVTMTGWDINPRVLGIVPKSYKVGPFKGMTWVNDAHYMVIPKGVPPEKVAAVEQAGDPGHLPRGRRAMVGRADLDADTGGRLEADFAHRVVRHGCGARDQPRRVRAEPARRRGDPPRACARILRRRLRPRGSRHRVSWRGARPGGPR